MMWFLNFLSAFRIVTMEFYGKNDLCLGVFLERYCFRYDRNLKGL